jgi:hypothetical protein
MSVFEEPTEAQIKMMRSLVEQINARVVKGPKKPSRWNNPVAAHKSHMAMAATDLEKAEKGEYNRGQVSACIDTMLLWAGR